MSQNRVINKCVITLRFIIIIVKRVVSQFRKSESEEDGKRILKHELSEIFW